MNELISVIMPAYNVEEYIEKSIDSVLRQTYTNWELIIINDGSMDNTKKIVENYLHIDMRIIYLEQENKGVSVARNKGIDSAKGKYIAFLDADDLWTKDALEKLYDLMKSDSDNKFVYGRTIEKFSSGKEQLIGPEGTVNGFLESYIHKTNELRLRSNTIALLIEKNLLDIYNIRFPIDIKISEDTYFIIKLLCVVPAIGMEDVIAFYMRRDDSATTSIWKPERWIGHVEIYFLLENFVLEHRKKAYIAFCCMRNYVAYRFILTCIRKGYVKQAQQNIVEWKGCLNDFCAGSGKIRDRMKCKAILFLYNKPVMLNLLGKL